MNKMQTLEDFYHEKMAYLPENLQQSIGHFNVFNLEDFVGEKAKPMPYNRRNYYKISLIIGKNRVEYADKVVETAKNVLFFATPHIPYNWTPIDESQQGYFCIFTEEFMLKNFTGVRLQDFQVFQPGGNPIFFLNDTQIESVKGIFIKMFEEIESNYAFKYDLLRNYVIELIHSALKMQPAATLYKDANAATRIASLFVELLERQFPIDTTNQTIKFRTANDFAKQLSVHVNHLNRALKEITHKTTTQLIAERIVQEAKILLKHTHWTIAEISYCLGFEEPAHFHHFFKKHLQITPKAFRD